MAVSFVGQNQAAATTVSMPAGLQANDLIVIFAYRNTTTAPSLPAGYTSASTASANSNSYRVGWKIAASNADTSGTWTNANVLQVVVYRGATGIGAVSGATHATSTTVAVPALTLNIADGSSWVTSFEGSAQTTSLGIVAGQAQRGTSQAGTTSLAVVADTDAGVSSYAGGNATAGTTAVYSTIAAEILAENTTSLQLHNTASGTVTGGTTVSAVFPYPNTIAGNSILLMVFCNSSLTVSTLIDTQGNTYNLIQSGGIGFSGKLYLATNIVGGANTITVTFGAASVALQAREYNGNITLDKQVSATGSGTAAASGNTATTTVATELVLGWVGSSTSGNVPSITTGYSNFLATNDPGGGGFAFADKQQSSTGTQSASSTIGSSNWIAAVDTFYITPTTQTILGKSRITITTTKTQTGKARVTATTTQTQLGKSRITASTPRTTLGKALVTAKTTKTQLGKAAVQKTTTQTQLGVANIGTASIVTTQTQLGKARITAIVPKTQTGKARITATTSQTQTGKAKTAYIQVYQAVTGAAAGTAGVASTFGITATKAKSSLVLALQMRSSSTVPSATITDDQGNLWTKIPGTSTSFGTLQGKAEFWVAETVAVGTSSISVTPDMSSLNMSVDIYELNAKDSYIGVDKVSQSTGSGTALSTGPTGTTVDPEEVVIGKAGTHITAGTLGTATGYTMLSQQGSAVTPVYVSRSGYRKEVATGTFSYANTGSGSGFWYSTIVTFQSITPTPQTIPGKARITAITNQTQLGKSRILTTVPQTILGKARVNLVTTKTVPGISRISAITPKTQAGKARITASTTQTQPGKARIVVTVPQTQLGKARINLITPQTITGKADIQKTATKTQAGKANILSLGTQTIPGKARITATTTQTQLGKADLSKVVTKTITGLGRVMLVTSKTQLGKSRVTAITAKTQTGKAFIQLPRRVIIYVTVKAQPPITLVVKQQTSQLTVKSQSTTVQSSQRSIQIIVKQQTTNLTVKAAPPIAVRVVQPLTNLTMKNTYLVP